MNEYEPHTVQKGASIVCVAPPRAGVLSQAPSTGEQPLGWSSHKESLEDKAPGSRRQVTGQTAPGDCSAC